MTSNNPDYISIYIDFLKKHSEIKKPITLVCDASNGSTGVILDKLLPQLNLKSYKIIAGNPDPEFPEHGPNPLLPGVLDKLCEEVKKNKADLGVAFDADGDRSFFVDETGTVIPSYALAGILFKGEKPPYVADELVYRALDSMNLFPKTELFASKVGVYFIKNKMKEVGATTGAEFSCHLYFKDFFGADSGLFALIRMLNIVSGEEAGISHLVNSFPKHFVANIDLSIAGKDWNAIQEKVVKYYEDKGARIERLEGISIIFNDRWLNVRPSNTEPLLRLYGGSPSLESTQAMLEEIKNLV